MIRKTLFKCAKLKKYIRSIYYQNKIPHHISNNYITLSSYNLDLMEASSDINYSPSSDIENDNNNVFNILNQRLEDHRKVSIPWLDSVRPIRNARILEIGCGQGTSTVALAEQGAKVTAIDLDDTLLQAAKTRCKIYGLNVDFHQLNATEVLQFFSGIEFDIIIFWAVLEHMTLSERMLAMKDTYDMLPDGGLWCIIGTPNRLHYFDSHTSGLPFFHWLPDDLAILYSKKSRRLEYSDCFNKSEFNSEDINLFNRWGRGVSYHEIELAIKPLHELNIISTLQSFTEKKGLISNLITKIANRSQYEILLRRKFPDINPCFFQPYLNLIIKK